MHRCCWKMKKKQTKENTDWRKRDSSCRERSLSLRGVKSDAPLRSKERGGVRARWGGGGRNGSWCKIKHELMMSPVHSGAKCSVICREVQLNGALPSNSTNPNNPDSFYKHERKSAEQLKRWESCWWISLKIQQLPANITFSSVKADDVSTRLSSLPVLQNEWGHHLHTLGRTLKQKRQEKPSSADHELRELGTKRPHSSRGGVLFPWLQYHSRIWVRLKNVSSHRCRRLFNALITLNCTSHINHLQAGIPWMVAVWHYHCNMNFFWLNPDWFLFVAALCLKKKHLDFRF